MKKLFSLFVFLILVSGIQSQNSNISNGNIFDGEPYLVVNPNNDQHLVVAWMGYVFGSGSALTIRVKTSFNGGRTWSAAVNIPHIYSTYKSADVSMGFSSQGKLFLSYIDYRETPDSGGVYVCRSFNGGLNWTAPVKAIDAYADGNKRPIDRPFLAVNPNGKDLYITTKPAPWILPPNRNYLVSSNDSGLTWMNWRYIDTTAYLVGNAIAAPMAAPAMASNGKFHCMYPSYVSSQNLFPQFIHASSNTNGINLDYHNAISSLNFPNNDTAKFGYQLLVNPSNSNHLVLLFPFTNSGQVDVYLSESMNEGQTWSAPARVNDDPVSNNKMQDLIWGAFDSDGDLIVTWRDRRNANGIGYKTATEFWAAFRPNGSSNFNANFEISDSLVAHNSILEQNGNDFMSCTLLNDTLSAVWSNTRDGSLDVWFVRTHAVNGGSTGLQLIESTQSEMIVYPNPASEELNFSLMRKQIISSMTLKNLNGQTLTDKQINSAEGKISLQEIPNGIYLLELRYKEGNREISIRKKIVVTH